MPALMPKQNTVTTATRDCLISISIHGLDRDFGREPCGRQSAIVASLMHRNKLQRPESRECAGEESCLPASRSDCGPPGEQCRYRAFFVGNARQVLC
jgi:hypothetical protein